MLACSLLCRMCTRNTSLTEKAWKVRQEVIMLLFTKWLLKVWLVISRNHNVGFFFFFLTDEFGIRNGTLPQLYFAFGKFNNRCVYASYKVEWSTGAVDLYHHAYYFKLFKTPPHVGKGGEAPFTQFSNDMDSLSTWLLMLREQISHLIFIGI